LGFVAKITDTDMWWFLEGKHNTWKENNRTWRWSSDFLKLAVKLLTTCGSPGSASPYLRHHALKPGSALPWTLELNRTSTNLVWCPLLKWKREQNSCKNLQNRGLKKLLQFVVVLTRFKLTTTTLFCSSYLCRHFGLFPHHAPLSHQLLLTASSF